DTNFNGTGEQTVTFGADDKAYGLALQYDGRIVLAGTDGPDFALARVENDRVSLSLTLDDGQTTIHNGQQLTYTLIVADGRPEGAPRPGSTTRTSRTTRPRTPTPSNRWPTCRCRSPTTCRAPRRAAN